MVDFFDPLLSLEEDYYQEGYAHGLADGEKVGRIEGRVFGLEKGFEKFLELGKLQGRCSVWKARLKPLHTPSVTPITAPHGAENNFQITNPRAQRQIESLALLLTHPPFKNDGQSVEEVEETLKRGKGKGKVLMNMLNEKDEQNDGKAGGAVASAEESIEDAGRGARGAGRI
ncbi:unnamed protein product [Tuber melanosporum]|uniref:(Perigord truffle) hypothetical protein n=1 Tax=Tuber melanosporum (strain Mel28) TaxID=656061 RepID=D5GIP9_TUBMM|nr:uncharacterized protein GSTUM_00008602001 [Tuber melanosporum]CAZ84392.1 unnamed protein product [Tuber melanosporum]